MTYAFKGLVRGKGASTVSSVTLEISCCGMRGGVMTAVEVIELEGSVECIRRGNKRCALWSGGRNSLER